MKTYVRKTHDVWCVEFWQTTGGWKHYGQALDKADAKQRLRVARSAHPRTPFRIVKHRVQNESQEE